MTEGVHETCLNSLLVPVWPDGSEKLRINGSFGARKTA